MKKTFLKVVAVSFLPTAIAISLAPSFNSASATSAQVGFNKISGIDFTNESMITHEKDASQSVEVGNLHYFDYNGDLLSIVDESEAKSGKACLVASATDYPRLILASSLLLTTKLLYLFLIIVGKKQLQLLRRSLH